jgi:hypothetical protein
MPEETVNQDPQPGPNADDKKAASETASMSPQEILAYESARSARIVAEARLAELQRENRDLQLQTTYEKAVTESGVTFHCSQKELLSLLSKEENLKLVPSADGTQVFAEVNGEKTDLVKVLQDFALRNRSLTDQRTLRGLVNAGEQIKARSHLADRAEVQAYIARHGLESYEALPMTRPRTSDPLKMTAREYLSLPMSEKARLAGELTELQITRILQRKEKP